MQFSLCYGKVIYLHAVKHAYRYASPDCLGPVLVMYVGQNLELSRVCTTINHTPSPNDTLIRLLPCLHLRTELENKEVALSRFDGACRREYELSELQPQTRDSQRPWQNSVASNHASEARVAAAG